MIDLIDSQILRVLTIFSVSPGSRFQRKLLKEKTFLPNIILDKTLNKLANINILNKEKNLYSINHGNTEIKKIIEICYENYNKFKQLPFKEYFLILNIKEELSKIKNLNDCYLFGSYSKLIFRENSDIDIAIISDSPDKKEIERNLRKFEKKHSKKIEIHYFSKKFYNNKRDPLVKEILNHGIKLI